MRSQWIVLLCLVPFSASAFLHGQDPEDLSEYCITCHDDIHSALIKGFHAGSYERRTDRGYIACQACHWPADTHAEDPSNQVFAFKKEAASEQSARCLACHQKSGMGQNLHQRGGVACTTCHVSGHGEDADPRLRLVRQDDPALCLNCHSRQKTQMQLPFRHRTSDGVLKCGDCHKPHERLTRQAFRLAGNESCFDCHTDKQGPFIYQHPSSSITGCESCHEPHGSTNPKLLTRSEVRFLCLECHGNTPSFHDLTQQRFQNCTLCHTAIHGSHVDETLLR